MAKANYTYEMVAVGNNKGIAITDLNNGSMSVTNDIETVVEEIEEKEQIDRSHYTIVYKDSESMWDGVEIADGKVNFILLQAKHWAHAINKYLKLQRESSNVQ